MTLQQLKYMITAAEAGSITEAAKELFISQPSLSGAIKEVEKEAGISIFTRCRAGIALTKEGMEFLGYARQVVQQMELLESKYISNQPAKQRFCISTQHYTFTANAFVAVSYTHLDSQYGTAYLTPGNGLFNQYFAVILTCLSDRCLQFLCPAYLIHAKRGAGTGRLYEDRVRERLRFQVVPFL